jgi:hypothetical protein
VDRFGRSRELVPTRTARNIRRLLPLLVTALLVAVLVGPLAAHAAGAPSSTEPPLVAQEGTTVPTTGGDGTSGTFPTTSPTTATDQTSGTSPTTSGATGQGTEQDQGAIIPPPAGQTPLNPGWSTDQMDIRVLPEYDQNAVLVIMGFALPADVQLPASVKFPLPAGATIAGIGEIDPGGGFTYNYADRYPEVEPGSEWDIATIEVLDFRELQIDYYYDPGLPQGPGERSFPILAQTPMDAVSLVMHVQQPAGATDFQIQPALQGAGQAGDGFTYSVGAFSDVEAGSTFGYQISYYKADAGLSIDSEQSGGGSSPQFNTNTVLLAAILVIVAIVGVLVVYRLYSRKSSPSKSGKGGRSGAARGGAGAAAPVGTKRQRQAGKSQKSTGSKGATSKGGAATGTAAKGKAAKDEAAQAATLDEDEPTDRETGDSTDSAPEQSDVSAEYCVACGEELTTDSPFCPKCGEARP